jgi:hypothetical protein
MFNHVIAVLVHGTGYERLAGPGCSDRTIRRRLTEWPEADVGQRVATNRPRRRWPEDQPGP